MNAPRTPEGNGRRSRAFTAGIFPCVTAALDRADPLAPLGPLDRAGLLGRGGRFHALAHPAAALSATKASVYLRAAA